MDKSKGVDGGGVTLAIPRPMRYAAGMAYTPPDPATFRLRYPEFAAVPDERVQYWLDDAPTAFDPERLGRNGANAAMLYAAHMLAGEAATGGADESEIPAGVTSMRSGSLSLSFDTNYVSAQAQGGYTSTRYGAQLASLLRSYLGGARVTNAGPGGDGVCYDVYGQSPHGGWNG